MNVLIYFCSCKLWTPVTPVHEDFLDSLLTVEACKSKVFLRKFKVTQGERHTKGHLEDDVFLYSAFSDEMSQL